MNMVCSVNRLKMVDKLEAPDAWRGVEGYPWEVVRPELTQSVGFYGHVEQYQNEQGETCSR